MYDGIQFETAERITPGTVELDPVIMTLFFHSQDELIAWKEGQPFKLIIRWIYEAKPPRGR